MGKDMERLNSFEWWGMRIVEDDLFTGGYS